MLTTLLQVKQHAKALLSDAEGPASRESAEFF
jgi:hypothetical protein